MSEQMMQSQTFGNQPGFFGTTPMSSAPATTSLPPASAPTMINNQYSSFLAPKPVKKRRSEKDYNPGIPKGYWWSHAEAVEAQRTGTYIKVNGGNRSEIPSSVRNFSFEATVLKGAPFKKRRDKKTGQVNPNAYSGQGMNIVFLDTFKVSADAEPILARLSGDPYDIALTLIFAGAIVHSSGADISRLPAGDRDAFFQTATRIIIGQSFNYYTIVEKSAGKAVTVTQMKSWDDLNNSDFYQKTLFYQLLNNPASKVDIDGYMSLVGDLYQRFLEESAKNIAAKDSGQEKLEDFQDKLLLYIFLSHHIAQANIIGPNGQPIANVYTLPGSHRRHDFASLLQQVYTDEGYMVDISAMANGGHPTRRKVPKETKDKKSTRSKSVPVNFSVVIGGQKYNLLNKVYTNNSSAVDTALKQLGIDGINISTVKSVVQAALKQKEVQRNENSAKKSSRGLTLKFNPPAAHSCPVSHYPTTPAAAGMSEAVGKAAGETADDIINQILGSSS